MLAPRARPPPPRETPADVAAEARLLAALADVPGVARGFVFPSPGGAAATLLVEWGQRDVPANRSRRFTTSHALVRGEKRGLLPPPPPPSPVAADVVLSSPSPSGARQLVVRAPPPPAPSKANRPADAPLSVEVWGSGRCLLELSVPPSVHGPVYGDGAWFGLGGASWSADESRVAYVAEAPPAATTPEWGRELTATAAAADGGGAAKDAAAPRGWRGLAPFSDDWGEQLAGCRAPAVFVLDAAAGAVVAPPPPAAGHPALAPDGGTVVYAAWPARPARGAGGFPALGRDRLGITYCTNRPCALWAAAVPAVGGACAAAADGDGDEGGAPPPPPPPVCLTPGLLSALSPRFAPDGRSLAFLSHDAAAASGVHCATAALHVLPWGGGAPAGPPRAVVPVVAAPPARDAFPGLYAAVLPDRPFVDATTIAVTSQWGPTSDVVLVDAATGRVARVADRAAFPGAWSFAGAGAGWLAAAVSGPAAPPDVVVLDTAASPPRWRRAARADGAAPLLRAPAAAALAGVTTAVLDVATAGPHPVHAIAVLPPGVELNARSRGAPPPPPALLIPHGGPHAAHTDAWNIATALFAGLGYTCLLVNYRGSTGYGEAAIQSLPGRIGDADVADCVAALDAAVAARIADPARVAAVGGSHGGFLVGNLVGRHPDRFKAGVLRNPVLDLSLMVNISDIPDWCWVEAFGPAAGAARAAATPTADDVARFRAVSPVSSAADVTAPLLLLLGGRDRRVPLEDAQRYVAALRARGRGAPATRVLVFPHDAHALDAPQTEFEAWLNAAAWLKEHVK